ncbi:MAG: AI-2E family transporter [Rikenellaceae bacterium]|nr:AI-2E family transporter [Rikenellaceae bacterium]
MNSYDKPFTFDRVVRIVITVAILVAIFFFINKISGALLPFLVAWLIAYMINPLVEFFQYRLGFKNRVLSIAAALLSITIVVGGIIWALIPTVSAEIRKFIDMVVSYEYGSKYIPFVPQSWMDFINEHINFGNWLEDLNRQDIVGIIERLMPKVRIFFSSSISLIVSLLATFIVLLYIVFILLDFDKISSLFINLIPPKFRKGMSGIFSDIKYSMNRYFRGQALVALLVGILFAIGFSIIGLPLGIILGLFIGMLNLVPYLQVIGFIPALMLCLLKSAETGQNFWVITGLTALVFVVVQIIQDGIIVPKIMGKITGLNPAIILLSLSIWGTLMEFIGLILALPMTTLLLSYYQRFIIQGEKLYEEPDKEEEK